MYEGIYLVFIRSLCIFVDVLTVCYTFIFFNIKSEYNITLKCVHITFQAQCTFYSPMSLVLHMGAVFTLYHIFLNDPMISFYV